MKRRMSKMKSNYLKEMYRDKLGSTSAPVKAAFWFTLCNFIQRGISMISTPIFTRQLSTYEYGVFSTYSSWEILLAMIVTLSIPKAMMNLYIKYEDRESVLSSICGLELVLTGIWLIVGIMFGKQIGVLLGLSPALVCCLFLNFMFSVPVQCWSFHKRYDYDYKPLVAVTLFLAIGSVLFSVLAVFFVRPTAEMRAIASVVVTIVLGMFLYCSIFRHKKKFYEKKVWKFAIGFSVPLLPHYLSEFILQSSDKIMINYFCGASDVALYSVAYAVGSVITLVTSAIDSSFAPYQYQKIKSGEYGLLKKRANEVLSLVGIMLALIMISSREIVLFFGGVKYINSVEVIIPICLGVFFNYIFQFFARVQEYYEQKLKVVIPSVLCAVLNLILNYICIRKYGYQAAAYTTLLCYALFCIVHYIFYKNVCRRYLNNKNIYDIKTIIFISIIVSICGFFIMILNNILWLKYLIMFITMIMLIIKRKWILTKIIKTIRKA